MWRPSHDRAPPLLSYKVDANPMAISFQRAPPISSKLSVVREKSGAREMDGRNLLGAAGADRAKRNKAKIVMIAVPVVAMLVLLLTAAAVAMAHDGPARLHALFCSKHLLMICVLSQINLACLFARKAVRARTLAARRFYAVGAVSCFVELALKLYMIRVVCPVPR